MRKKKKTKEKKNNKDRTQRMILTRRKPLRMCRRNQGGRIEQCARRECGLERGACVCASLRRGKTDGCKLDVRRRRDLPSHAEVLIGARSRMYTDTFVNVYAVNSYTVPAFVGLCMYIFTQIHICWYRNTYVDLYIYSSKGKYIFTCANIYIYI